MLQISRVRINRRAKRKNKTAAGLSDELDCDIAIDVASGARFAEKPPDRFAAGLAIGARLISDVHTDEFGRQRPIHVTSVRQRVLYRLATTGKPERDAIAHNCEEIALKP